MKTLIRFLIMPIRSLAEAKTWSREAEPLVNALKFPNAFVLANSSSPGKQAEVNGP